MSTDTSQGRSAARAAQWRTRAVLLAFALAFGTALSQPRDADQPTPLAATGTAAAIVPSSTDTSKALARYVAKPDPTFNWELHTRYRVKGAEAVELVMQSQTWQGVAWKHQLVLIKPRGLEKPDHALVIVGGGRWQESFADPAAEEEDLPKGGDVFVGLAKLLHTVVVVVAQVPYQPLFDLTEDRLIAYTFDKYERTGDPEWPLLLPMVKSVVRALDASDAAARREWGQPLTTFTLFGASKRGWTARLDGRREPRGPAALRRAAFPASDGGVRRPVGGDQAVHRPRSARDLELRSRRAAAPHRRPVQLPRRASAAEDHHDRDERRVLPVRLVESVLGRARRAEVRSVFAERAAPDQALRNSVSRAARAE